MAKKLVPVSERALFSRVDRALRKNGELIRRCKQNTMAFTMLGSYYLMDIERNQITTADVDLEKIGRKMKVLRPYEALQE